MDFNNQFIFKHINLIFEDTKVNKESQQRFETINQEDGRNRGIEAYFFSSIYTKSKENNQCSCISVIVNQHMYLQNCFRHYLDISAICKRKEHGSAVIINILSFKLQLEIRFSTVGARKRYLSLFILPLQDRKIRQNRLVCDLIQQKPILRMQTGRKKVQKSYDLLFDKPKTCRADVLRKCGLLLPREMTLHCLN